MIRTSLVVLCALVLVPALAAPAAAAEAGIKDVAPGHWAYQAVKTLVDQGYLGLYADRTFRGSEPVDRYTLAMVVARLLQESVGGGVALTKEDSELLRRLTGEFRGELVDIAARTKDLEEALARYERDKLAMGADLAAWRDETAKVRDDLAAALRGILELKERVSALEASVSRMAANRGDQLALLEDEVKQLRLRTMEMENKMKLLKYVAAALAIVAVIN